MTANPTTLSVIIASVNGPPMIDECLAALAAQRGGVDAEVIVADVMGGETVRLIETKFPWVRLVTFTDRRTIPQLRAAGLAQSRGEIIAIIEDHCVAADHWFEEMVRAHRAHPECIAVGGAVENGSRDRLVDWAVSFCEYSRYMRPLTGGIVEDIPGNNASYKRAAFADMDGLQEALNQGFWETTLHERLRVRGEQFLLQPSIVVYHKKHFGFRYFLSQRYHYSRYYAGMLTTGAGLLHRALRGAASLALPPLLWTRMARRVVGKRRHLREFMLATPLLAVFTGAWAIGELVGCLLGPGQSLNRVE
jgi:GT2 family glycosyltransferase